MSSSNIAKTVVVSLESPKLRSMAWDTFGNLACVRGYEKVYNETRAASPMFPEINFGYTTHQQSNGLLIKFGAVEEAGSFTQNGCGTMFIAKSTPFQSSNLGVNTPGSQQTGVSSWQITQGASRAFNFLGDLAGLNGDLDSVDAEHIGAVGALISSIDSTARAFVNNPSDLTSVESQVNAAAMTYSESVKGAAASIISTLGDFRQLEESATQDGWMLAGAWFMRMSYLQDVASKAVSKSPEVSPPSSNINEIFADQFNSSYLKYLVALQENADGASNFGIANSASQSTSADAGAGGFADWVRSGFSLDYYLKKMFRWSYQQMTGNDTEHPILQMKRVGEWSAYTAGAMYAAYIKFMPIIGVAQGSGVSLAIATLPITMIVFSTLIAVSFTLIYVLPMMPFFIWFGLFIGWVVLVVQALLAAPMWAVMHLSPHGDDLTGSGAQGYKLVLSLLLRPVLMIFGLIAALTMITVIGQVVNRIFFDVFLLAQQDSSLFVMIVGFLATPLLYAGFMYTVITKILSVIHIVPDQMLNWFGGGGPNLGEYSDMGHKGSSTYVALGSVANIGGRAIEGNRQMQDLKQQRKQTGELVEANAIKEAQGNMDLASKFGNVAPDFKDYASGSHLGQKNTMAGIKAVTELSEAQKTVGGADSFAGQSLNRRVEEGVKENLAKPPSEQQSYREILDNATARTVNEKYGDRTSAIASGIGGGMSGSGFSNAVGLYEQKASELKRAGASDDEIKSTFADINQKTAEQFDTSPDSVANGGNRSLASFLNENMNGSRNNGEVVDRKDE